MKDTTQISGGNVSWTISGGSNTELTEHLIFGFVPAEDGAITAITYVNGETPSTDVDYSSIKANHYYKLPHPAVAINPSIDITIYCELNSYGRK